MNTSIPHLKKFFQNIRTSGDADLSAENKQRIPFIDTAKGICILLVIIIHCELTEVHNPVLGMVRMPFYFTISGMFFKTYGGFFQFLIKKTNRLLVPFFFFYPISYFLYAIIAKFFHQVIDIPVYSFLYSKILINYALWFLAALFWANIMFFVLIKLIHNRFLLWIAVLSISCMAFHYFDVNHQCPMFIDSACSFLPYFMFGYMLRRSAILYPNPIDKYNIPLIAILLGISLICYYAGHTPYINFCYMDVEGNPYCYALGSLCAVTALILLCKTIGNIPVVRYLGRYSIIPLCTHLIVYRITWATLEILPFEFQTMTVNIIIFCNIILSSFILIPLLKRYIPKFTAQEDLIPGDLPEAIRRRLPTGNPEQPAK